MQFKKVAPIKLAFWNSFKFNSVFFCVCFSAVQLFILLHNNIVVLMKNVIVYPLAYMHKALLNVCEHMYKLSFLY